MEIDIETLEQHLLYHKALAETPERIDQINGYIGALRSATDGTRLNDEVDETIRRMFALVIDNGFDPWNIDLEYFVSIYSQKVASGQFDILVAGKLLYTAWRILSMQASDSHERAKPVEMPMEDIFDDEAEFIEVDEDPVLEVPDVVFTPAYSRTETRKVTLIDLMDAFDAAVEEQKIRDEREKLRGVLIDRKAKAKAKFDNKAHEEDDEAVVKRVYKTIIERSEAGPITMRGLYNGNLGDSISCFVSVLHLVRYGLLEIEQESLPSGDIYITVLDPTKEVPVGTEA